MNNNYYQSPKSSWLMRMFWKAAGADQYLLERSTYSDQIKYFCLGGIVVATGVMAALAGGYAFYTIFEPKGDALDNLHQIGTKTKDIIHFPTLLISLVFGLIWGLIIYNIDRFIVTSTGKGDGTEAITKQELISAIPRIIMGMIIALTISKPIEIRMFKSEIDKRLATEQENYLREQDSTTTLEFDSKISPFLKESDSLKKANENLRIEIQNQRRRLEDEAAGLLPPNPPGRGPAWQDKKENLDKMESEFLITKESNEKRIKELKPKIEELEKKKKNKFNENIKKKNSMDGLLFRIKYAEEEAGWVISLFITLLFMVIELTPIFFKMMLIKGPYDYMDDNIKELARAESGIEVIYNYYEDAQGMEAHKVVNHAAELKKKEKLLIIQAQEELNEKIIQNWKKEKLTDIENNPSKYISEK
jgi:hypothetical protein